MKTRKKTKTSRINAIISNHYTPVFYLRYIITKYEKSVLNSTLSAILLLIFYSAGAQMKECKDCSVPSFGVITVYYVAQPHSGFGFGMEAGKWNKDDSRFSYFIGAKLQWFDLVPGSDKYSNSDNNIHYTAYVKGQFEMLNRLYVVVSPEFVNLSSFDARAGLRYVFPISNNIGVGVEPAYAIVQKAYSVNANIHFALW